MKLLNQISNYEHYSRTVTYDEDDTAGRVTVGNRARWGNHKFISNEGLHMVTPTCRYFKDDCTVSSSNLVNRKHSILHGTTTYNVALAFRKI